MRTCHTFYIAGQWCDPYTLVTFAVENPATETTLGSIAVASDLDVDRAVKAARTAFVSWSKASREDRLDLLRRIAVEYERRADDLAHAVTLEIGAPASISRSMQVEFGLQHLKTAIEVLEGFSFENASGPTMVVREPIGVCGLITPWNWPLNQAAVKIFPAIATGCTVILKPSEISPFSAQILAEVLAAADTPPGVFNLVQGDGPTTGRAMAAHPGIDMISFTGSTRAGADIARTAADTVKRIGQELGGKSAHIILDDETLPDRVRASVETLMVNTGQTCNAPTRLLVPRNRLGEAEDAARHVAEAIKIGDPLGDAQMGPVASHQLFGKIQSYIQIGLEEGATLVVGGLGRPEGIDRGHFVRPTVFSQVQNHMRIAREEIFGPVLCILAYDDLHEAIGIANDTDYGLSAFVSGVDVAKATSLAKDLRAGSIGINGAFDLRAPFGGYKQSGNGREWGEFGFHEFLEIKGIVGYARA